MDPDLFPPPATFATGFAPRIAPTFEPDRRDMMARVLAAYPSPYVGDWSPAPPSQFAVENADPLTRLGLAELYPDRFGHLLSSGPPDDAAISGPPQWESPNPHSASPTAAQQGDLAPASGSSPVHANLPISSSMKWMLPNGQQVVIDDTVEDPTVVYHRGSVGGSAGMFVDNPSDPQHYQTVFTPSGLDPTKTYGFTVAPEIGPSGERYYDKVAWQAGPRQAMLRVDARGQPVKAFTLDTGEVHEAAVSPFDFLGPIEAKVAVDGLASATKVGLRPLSEDLSETVSKLAPRFFGRQTSKDAADAVIQRGGAHADVRGVPGYHAHHMPADSASPLPRRKGPSIAMLEGDHKKTASWGRAGKSYRQRQTELIRRGDFRAAQQLDVDDVRNKFGTRYDDAIGQMLQYTDKHGY